jgi:hypothetical protein
VSEQEILAAYPDRKAEEVREALRYAAEAFVSVSSHPPSPGRHFAYEPIGIEPVTSCCKDSADASPDARIH